MARARNLKPSFFTNDELAEVEPLGRLLFQGLWCIADREGRLEDRPKRIKAELLPYDNCDVDALLSELERHDFVLRYAVDGGRYIQVINFAKHQDPHYKEKASAIPAPPGHEDSGKTAGAVSEMVRSAVFERDGFACRSCGQADDLSIDHVIPRSKGGSHDVENLQTLCRRCNSAKNNRQAKAELGQSSSDDRPIIGRPSEGQSPLIPDSLNPLTDSGFPVDAPAKPSRQSKGERMPADWEPSDADVEFCRTERPDLQPSSVASQFRDYWVAQPGAKGRKADWPATWRNWVRNQRANAPPRASPAYQTRLDQQKQVLDELTGRTRSHDPDDPFTIEATARIVG